jgi:hypothetical protein
MSLVYNKPLNIINTYNYMRNSLLSEFNLLTFIILLISSFFIILPLVFGTISSIILTSPDNNTNTSTAQPNFNFTAASDINTTFTCELFIDDTGYGQNTSTSNNTATIIQANTSISQGVHSWYINCTDVNGTQQSATRTLTVDTTTPSINLNSPVDNLNTSSTSLNLSFTATDNLASTMSCELILDGSINQTNNSVSNNTATIFTVSSLSQGQHTWNVNCTDNANNEGTGTQRTLTVDTTTPSINITTPTIINPTYKQPGMNLTISYTYTELNPKNITLYLLNQSNSTIGIRVLDNTSNIPGGVGQVGSSYITIPNNATEGYYYVRAVMFDQASNSNSITQPNATYITNQTFNFAGTTKYTNGTLMNGTNITVEVYQMLPNQGPSLVDSFTDISNENGTFNVTSITKNNNLFYKPIVRHFNGTTLDYIGPSLPEFPYQEMQNLGSINFYLREGATLNITAVNSTGGAVSFDYMVKDTKLGYPIAMRFGQGPNSGINQTTIYVPADRNYSIMIYPSNSFPVSYDLSNLTGQPEQRDIQFNVSQMWKWVSGYVTYNGSANFTNLTIITFLLEPGNMISKDHPLPSNMGLWTSNPRNDTFNATTGFFNITLPATTSGTSMLLFANAQKGTSYYGNFRNLTLAVSSNNVTGFNFTLYELLGSNSTINVEKAQQGGMNNVNISTKESSFYLTNGTTYPQNAHIKIELDYTDVNGATFTYMTDIEQSDGGVFKIPVISHKIDRINIFSANFAPKKLSLEASDLATQPYNITLRTFRPGGVDNEIFTDLYIDMLMYGSECDIPYPSANCSLISSTNLTEFNPLGVVMSGAKMSFRMRKASNNITIHYVNVDLLASGPPDAVFDSNSSDTAASTFAQAWRFGSEGPEIYDYVIIGVPYTEASTSETGYNDSADINLSIPYLYDDNWNIIWNQSAGDNISDIQSNDTLKDFEDYLNTTYEVYLNGTGVTCNASDVNLTGLCYKDTTNNMLWFKILHFSGVGPENEGTILKANEASCTAASECVGGYCVHEYCRSTSTYCGDGYCDSGESCSSDNSACSSGYVCTNGCRLQNTGGGSSGGGGAYTPPTEKPKNATKKLSLVPGVGLRNNTKLQAALEKVLAKGKMSQQAVDNLIRLSESITSDLEATRNFKVEQNKSRLELKIKYKGKKKAKNFIVYDKIPKTFANSTDLITVTAPGATIEIIEKDPEYSFIYPEISEGDELSITYETSGEKDSSTINETSIEFYAESLEEPSMVEEKPITSEEEKKPSEEEQPPKEKAPLEGLPAEQPNYIPIILVILAIVLIIGLGYYFEIYKKKK